MHISVIVQGRSISNTGQESGFSPEEGEAIYSLSNLQPSVFTILLLLLHHYFVLVLVLVRQAGIVYIMVIEQLSNDLTSPHKICCSRDGSEESAEPKNLIMQDIFYTRVFTENCL